MSLGWMGSHHTTVYKISNKDLLNSTRNGFQYLAITSKGKESEKCVCIHRTYYR